jgi:hypothetical protein
MVPTAVLELTHVPPAVVLLSVMVEPWHTESGPAIGGAGVTTETLIGTRPLEHPATTWDTYHVYSPGVAVDGVGAVDVPTPPVAEVNHMIVPIPDARAPIEPVGAPWQNEVSCTVGVGVTPGGMTVNLNILLPQPPIAEVPVIVYVTGAVIVLANIPFDTPVVESR